MAARAGTRTDIRARIYGVVRRIPAGAVATYGQVAALAGLRGHPRQVGYALHALPDDSGIPWHRVVNAKGRVSPRATPGPERVQRARLEAEGVVFDEEDRIDLDDFGWHPRARQSLRLPGCPSSSLRGRPRRNGAARTPASPSKTTPSSPSGAPAGLSGQ